MNSGESTSRTVAIPLELRANEIRSQAFRREYDIVHGACAGNLVQLQI